ncbi:hypothetical protein ACFXQA_09880 [Microbacterium sp. P07]|uniref:hypothetical protein n=1 Tax=Microbacterium sp. P07 TaxID=3366952 RepID=UPI003746F666
MKRSRPVDRAGSDPQHARYIVKCAIIAVYGIATSIVGTSTIREVSGPFVEQIWAWLVPRSSATATPS